MSLVELSSLFWLALTFQWEFNFNGSFNITGIREKWDFVCAFVCRVGRNGKKTDILDLFWHFSIEVISECFNCKHYFWHTNQSIPISLWLKNVKTDILDIFWHFSIKVILECFFFFTLIEKCQNWYSWYLLTFFNQSDIGMPLFQTLFLAHQLMHFDITSIEKCQNRSRMSVFLPWELNG